MNDKKSIRKRTLNLLTIFFATFTALAASSHGAEDKSYCQKIFDRFEIALYELKVDESDKLKLDVFKCALKNRNAFKKMVETKDGGPAEAMFTYVTNS